MFESCDAELWDVISPDDFPEIAVLFSDGGGKGWICTKYLYHTGPHIGGNGPPSKQPDENDDKWIEWDDTTVLRYQTYREDIFVYNSSLSQQSPFVIEELF